VSTTEGAAYGAAVLAAAGVAWFPTVEAASASMVHVTPMAAPGPDQAAYAEWHARYRELYPALAPTFHRL
jgi:xylulokinase